MDRHEDFCSEVFGGIEGGGSCTHIVLLDGAAKVITEASVDLSTNHWTVGMENCIQYLNDLTCKAKEKAGLDPNKPLKSLGIALSGADDEESCKIMKSLLISKFPSLSSSVTVVCDTVGSLATVFPSGGMMLIAGTGSSCLLLNPDGSTFRCGGWGHMLGDEGSGFWISHYCIKTLFDTLDGLNVSQHDVTVVQEIIYKYFNVTDQFGMLKHMYTNFRKKFIAGLCVEIAKAAKENKDPLCLHAFHEAGRVLAYHICSLVPKMSKDLLNDELHIACTGSVFKSWDLLQRGFEEGVRLRKAKTLEGKELKLCLIKKNSTYGAACIGAKDAHVRLMLDYPKNSELFYSFQC